jgi:hypothetical protein
MFNYITSKLKIALIALMAVGLVAGCGAGGSGSSIYVSMVPKVSVCPVGLNVALNNHLTSESSAKLAASGVFSDNNSVLRLSYDNDGHSLMYYLLDSTHKSFRKQGGLHRAMVMLWRDDSGSSVSSNNDLQHRYVVGYVYLDDENELAKHIPAFVPFYLNPITGRVGKVFAGHNSSVWDSELSAKDKGKLNKYYGDINVPVHDMDKLINFSWMLTPDGSDVTNRIHSVLDNYAYDMRTFSNEYAKLFVYDKAAAGWALNLESLHDLKLGKFAGNIAVDLEGIPSNEFASYHYLQSLGNRLHVIQNIFGAGGYLTAVSYARDSAQDALDSLKISNLGITDTCLEAVIRTVSLDGIEGKATPVKFIDLGQNNLTKEGIAVLLDYLSKEDDGNRVRGLSVVNINVSGNNLTLDDIASLHDQYPIVGDWFSDIDLEFAELSNENLDYERVHGLGAAYSDLMSSDWYIVDLGLLLLPTHVKIK